MAASIGEYMEERRRECKELSLHHNEHPVYSIEAGSGEKRGRILLTLNMTERANLQVSGVVEIRGSHVHRLEYAYYLVLDGREYWARDFDPIHGYHGHTIGHRRVVAGRVTFKEAAAMAWDIVSQEEDLTGADPIQIED
ncbi:MAG: hypothetical protein JSS68_18310 [Actinobacteria bacterium]|nr:hypothetical protein [Actinomycetota bacterium]